MPAQSHQALRHPAGKMPPEPRQLDVAAAATGCSLSWSHGQEVRAKNVVKLCLETSNFLDRFHHKIWILELCLRKGLKKLS